MPTKFGAGVGPATLLLFNLTPKFLGGVLCLCFGRTGQKIYGNRSMHDVDGPEPNPYQVCTYVPHNKFQPCMA